MCKECVSHEQLFFKLLLSSADFLFKMKIFKIFFREHYQSVKLVGAISGPTFCPSLGPDMDLNCSQMLSGDDRNRHFQGNG